MSNFIITHKGKISTPSGLGISETTLTLSSGAADELSFYARRAASQDVAVFTPGDAIRVTIDGVCRFTGTIQPARAQGSEGRMGDVITALGPWEELDRLSAVQLWTKVDAASGTEQSVNQCRILFGANGNGDPVTTGTMLESLIDDAIERGVQIAKGSIVPGIAVPTWEQVDITISQAITAILKWHPSAVVWWDYTTAVPTINIVEASSLPITSLDTADPNVGAIDVVDRTDLQVAGVVILYERKKSMPAIKTTTISGRARVMTQAQAAATGATGTSTGSQYFEYITKDESPSGVDLLAPGVLIHTITWSDADIEPPTGLAAAIMADMSTLYAAGTVTLCGTPGEVPIARYLGSRLSIDDVAGMCIVSRVSYSIDDGRTAISVSPGGSLSIRDRIDLFQRAKKSPKSVLAAFTPDSVTSGSGSNGSTPTTGGLPDGYSEEHFRVLDGDVIVHRYLLTRYVNSGEA